MSPQAWLMAVPQQLARLSSVELIECSQWPESIFPFEAAGRMTMTAESGGFDPSSAAAPWPVPALGHQQLGRKPAVGQLLSLGGIGGRDKLGAQCGQAQHPASLVDGGLMVVVIRRSA